METTTQNLNLVNITFQEFYNKIEGTIKNVAIRPSKMEMLHTNGKIREGT